MADIKQNVEHFKALLKSVELEAGLLREQGVVLNFTIASEKKTVEVQSASIFEISCKATINQEL